jgi:hypothetical protein
VKYILQGCVKADSFAIKIKQMQQAEGAKEQMYTHIEQWKQSGLSQKVYCEQQAVKYHVFHYWYKVYRDEHLAVSQQQPKPSASFIPLTLSSSSAAVVELHLPGGHHLLFHQMISADYLKALIS